MTNTGKWVIGLVCLGCILMAFVDSSKMDYVSKAGLKIITFTMVPLCHAHFIEKKSLKSYFSIKFTALKFALGLGLGLYIAMMLLYFLVRPYFDLSQLTDILQSNFKTGTLNFVPIAIYIAVINSFLEEFFFRGFAYLTLMNSYSKTFTGLFSALSFALYHVFLMAGLFPLDLYLMALSALIIAGYLFNLLDTKSKTILPSWFVHFCANWGLNTIGFILLKIIF